MELTNEFIALVVGDGENNHHSVCPANASIQLFVAAQAVLVDLNTWSVLNLNSQGFTFYLDLSGVEITYERKKRLCSFFLYNC